MQRYSLIFWKDSQNILKIIRKYCRESLGQIYLFCDFLLPEPTAKKKSQNMYIYPDSKSWDHFNDNNFNSNFIRICCLF